ncbi:hypothetical protein I4U23_008335 [Adineta vaga]|nr:hypothetical protein I4U23_008335 [Adineta vaga]
MGIIQARSLGTWTEPERCWLCLNRYQRERLSSCTCNHCSRSLCSECMNIHTNELPQNVGQLSKQLHDLEELLQTKQDIVQEELIQSKQTVKEYLKKCQNDLLEINQEITIGIKNEKQNTELRYVMN